MFDGVNLARDKGRGNEGERAPVRTNPDRTWLNLEFGVSLKD